MGNAFYVMKEETRVDGPWKDTGSVHIPSDMKDTPTWRPWQEDLLTLLKVKPDRRTVICIVDVKGNTGKSTLVSHLAVRNLATKIPPLNDYKDLSAIMMAKEETGIVFMDMPRALPKKALHALYSAIEEIKGGYVFDTRYHYQEKWLEPLHFIVMTNVVPNKSLLSADRWKFLTIDTTGKLADANF